MHCFFNKPIFLIASCILTPYLSTAPHHFLPLLLSLYDLLLWLIICFSILSETGKL